MSKNITYRTMYYKEIEAVCAMVMRIFEEHIAPLVSYKGKVSFGHYILPTAMEKRLKRGHFTLVALSDEEIIGMIEIREYKHIALLFVETACQGQGIATELIDEALALCFQHNPELASVTVNASINARTFYENFGFEAYAEPENELQATPMVLKLKKKEASEEETDTKGQLSSNKQR